jgi:hypothetical protein
MRMNRIKLVSIIITTLCFRGYFIQPAIAQTADSTHVAIPCFGGLTGGPITVSEHLGDTLAFTDSLLNSRFEIVSFNLALKCNGNVIKYLENKKGNTLTPEMKAAAGSLHQNCTLNFDGIKSRSKLKDISGKYTETKLKPLVLKVQ